jgi:hypothetical protein
MKNGQGSSAILETARQLHLRNLLQTLCRDQEATLCVDHSPWKLHGENAPPCISHSFLPFPGTQKMPGIVGTNLRIGVARSPAALAAAVHVDFEATWVIQNHSHHERGRRLTPIPSYSYICQVTITGRIRVRGHSGYRTFNPQSAKSVLLCLVTRDGERVI